MLVGQLPEVTYLITQKHCLKSFILDLYNNLKEDNGLRKTFGKTSTGEKTCNHCEKYTKSKLLTQQTPMKNKHLIILTFI